MTKRLPEYIPRNDYGAIGCTPTDDKEVLEGSDALRKAGLSASDQIGVHTFGDGSLQAYLDHQRKSNEAMDPDTKPVNTRGRVTPQEEVAADIAKALHARLQPSNDLKRRLGI